MTTPIDARRGLRAIRAMVRLHPRPFTIAVCGAAVFAMATVASAWALGWVTDNVIVPRFEEGEVAAGTVATGIGLIVGIGLLKAAGIVVRRVAATIAGARIQATLRKQVVRRYQEVPYVFHRRRPTGELISHAGNDVDAAVEVLAPLPYSTGVLVIVALSVAWMLATDLWLALVGFTVFPILAVVNLRYRRAIAEPAEHVQERLGTVSAVAHESFDGALVVKVLGSEAIEAERFAGTVTELRDAKVRVATIRAAFEAVLDALPALGTLILLPIGAWRVEQGAITAGTIVSFVALFQLLVFPLRLIGYVLGELPRSVVGHDRIQRVLAEPVDPRHAVGPVAPAAPGAPGARLEVRSLSFAHEPGIAVLDDVSFTVEAGRTVAVVGPTGCGKSTLCLLVAGLLEPEAGAIYIDDRDLSSLPVDELRATVATAFQEAFLFAATVSENVLLGWPGEQLGPALDIAGAARFVADLEGSHDAVVGERGTTLSGGQRQRLALARALIRGPRLLLLDDATSAVDPTTEAGILTALRSELAGTTTLVVASRPATIALADEVLFLEAGRLVDHGTHEELVARQPSYRRMVQAYELDRAARAGMAEAGAMSDAIDVLLDGDDEARPPEGALTVVRRGMAVSPELRVGLPLTILLALIGATGRVLVPVLIQQVIDKGVTDTGVDLEVVWRMTGIAVVALTLTTVTNWRTRVRLARAAEGALANLRSQAFRHVHRLSIARHTENRRGVLVARVTSDVEQLSTFFSWGGIAWVVSLSMMVAVAVTMAIYDWRLAGIAIVSSIPLFLVLKFLQKRILAAWDLVRTRVGEMLGAIGEAVSGAAVIRAYGVQERTTERVSEAIDNHRRAYEKAGSLGAVLFPANEVFAVFTVSLVIVAGLIIGPAGGLTAGEMVAFLFLVALFLEPIAEFTEILDQTQTAVAGWRKVLDVLATPIEVDDPGDAGVELPDDPPEVRVERVSYRYPNGAQALTGIDAVIPAGASVAIVGATGSGKSTLAKLLVRLADPSEGRILVHDLPLDTVRFSSLRSRLVLVPQEGFLFDGSILDNVRFANPKASEADVRLAFSELGLDEWLDTMPHGLVTEVGQRGESLSVGERQLVSLARAYVANPTCLLLDEATSAVDPGTETRIARALESLARGRTSITIAHRLSTAERADWVLVLEHGRLVEQGSHADLVVAGGAYSALHASWMSVTAAG